MAENHNTPEPSMQDATAASAASSPMTTSPMFLNSSPPEGAEGDTLMRAADTPLESSPAPTGITIEVGKKRKRQSGRNGGDADADDEDGDDTPRKKGKGRKAGTGKSVCSPFALAHETLVRLFADQRLLPQRRKASTPA